MRSSVGISQSVGHAVWLLALTLLPITLQAQKTINFVVLNPPKEAPNVVIELYVNAEYNGSLPANNDENFTSIRYTINGASSCINNSPSITLTNSAATYGPYAITTPDVADGIYPVTVDIFSNQNCKNSGKANPSAGSVDEDLEIQSGNLSPTAVDDTATTDEETPNIIKVYLNDSDTDGALDQTTVTITEQPLNGAVVVDPVTGAVTYTPELNFEGDDTFSYTIDDDGGATSNEATVTVTVSGLNDPPSMTGDYTATVVKGQGYSLTTSDLFYRDIDDGDTGVTFTVSGETNGEIRLSGVVTSTFTAADLVAGLVQFVHDDSDTATGQFTLSVDDGNEDASAPGSQVFSISVVSANAAYLEVGAFYDLSDEPLELVTPSSPNVLVLQDTSVSLNADIMTDETDGYYPDPADADSPYDNIYGIAGGKDAPKELSLIHI